MKDGTVEGNGKIRPPSSRRQQRAKKACEPCRLRKRRCDGSLPCTVCKQSEDNCYFENHPRKRSKLVEQDAAEKGIVQLHPSPKRFTPQTSEADASKMQSMEANSGIAFTRSLGTRLDAGAFPKLSTFGWNLGMQPTIASATRPITDFLNQENIITMAQVFFTIIHPIYGVLDQGWFMEEILLRYTTGEPGQCPDHLMAGVAALGVLFSHGSSDDMSQGLVDSAKLELERTSTLQPPSLYDVQSWILRTIYLRATGHPHACWLASNTSMHLIEACGLQQESTTLSTPSSDKDHINDSEIKRRTFWVARMLNAWVSFDCGHRQVTMRGVTLPLPACRKGDYTRKYIDLYTISCCLDPETPDKNPDLEDLLHQLDIYDAPHDCIELSRANLALCAYRRLRLRNSNLSTETISRVLAIGLAGLQAARNVADKSMPWWHVANVPFQFICIALAIDNRQSLTLIGKAMRTLDLVVNRFNTTAMTETLKTAHFLVGLSKRKKDKDFDILDQIANPAVIGNESNLENLDASRTEAEGIHWQQPEQQVQINQVWQQQQQQSVESMEQHQQQVPWNHDHLSGTGLEDWQTGFVNNTEIDWDYFLGDGSNRLW